MSARTEFLAALFALKRGNGNAPPPELVYAEAGLNLGTRPWWPALATVWCWPPKTPPPAWENAETWQEAAALLDDLYAAYLAARADRR